MCCPTVDLVYLNWAVPPIPWHNVTLGLTWEKICCNVIYAYLSVDVVGKDKAFCKMLYFIHGGNKTQEKKQKKQNLEYPVNMSPKALMTYGLG